MSITVNGKTECNQILNRVETLPVESRQSTQFKIEIFHISTKQNNKSAYTATGIYNFSNKIY